MIPLLFLIGCATTITVQTRPEGASVFITDYPPSPSIPPTSSVASGTSPYVCNVEYYTWENYYLWTSAPGCETYVQPIHGEIKVPQLIGGIFCCFPLIAWAYGPDDMPINVNMKCAAPPTEPSFFGTPAAPSPDGG